MTSIGQKKTQQRAIIIDVVKNSNGPMTTNDIHEEAQKTLSRIGTATVYRTLALLLEAGDVKKIIFSDGQVRYEAAHQTHHHHFICRVCETTFCFDICPVKTINKKDLPKNFHIDTHELTLHGTCNECTINN